MINVNKLASYNKKLSNIYKDSIFFFRNFEEWDNFLKIKHSYSLKKSILHNNGGKYVKTYLEIEKIGNR